MSDAAPFRPNRVAWTLILGAIAFAYLFPAPYFGRLNNPNENVRVYTTRAIVDYGTFAIEDVIDEWGYVNDKATFDGHMYSAKAPAASFMAIPGYWAYSRVSHSLGHRPSQQELTLVCRLTTTVPLLLVFLFAFARFSDRVMTDPAVRMLSVVAVALGSTMLTYGGMFLSHALTAGALFSVYMLTYRQREAPTAILPALLIGFCVGLAPALEYPGAVGGAFMGLYAIYRAPHRVRFMLWSAAGAALPIVLVLWVHYECFGSPFEFPHGHLEDPDQVLHHVDGFFGMDRISPTALHGSLFSPSNGLFWFAPWTMVPVVGLVFAIQFERLREPAFVTGGILLLYVLFVSMVHNWRGGWTAGPRYIVPVIPFLGWYLLVFLAELRRTGMGPALVIISFGLLTASLFTCGIAAAMFPHYPPGIDNPTFELSAFLLRRNYAPYTALAPLGITGAASLLPIGVAHVIALVTPFTVVLERENVERAAACLLALAVGSGFLLIQSVPCTNNDEYLWETRALLADVWEPVDDAGRAMHRRGRLPSAVKYGRASADELRELAATAARMGMGATATDLYAEAAEAE